MKVLFINFMIFVFSLENELIKLSMVSVLKIILIDIDFYLVKSSIFCLEFACQQKNQHYLTEVYKF